MTSDPRRLKTSEISGVRKALLEEQKQLCALCGGKLGGTGKQPVLDHCHQSGFIRDVLCRNCNGIEGRVFNLARRAKHNLTEIEWLQRMVMYHARHQTPQHGGLLHPTHKSEEEKRLARSRQASKPRAPKEK